MTRNALSPVQSFMWSLLAIIAALAAAGPVHAQGTFGTLPDPITSSELTGYADRLGLSAEQRRAVGGHYEQYHEQFRALRDGEIADFLASMRQLQGSGMQMPQRRQMEDFMKSWDRMRDRIRVLDDQFFTMIQTVLTEQQAARVPRIRMARERYRYRNELRMSFGGDVQDLSSILLTMNITPEQREAIDPHLALYERQLTAAMRDQRDSSATFMLDMYDALEAAGLNEDSMQDPEEAQRFMQVMQDVMADMMQRAAADTAKLRSINHHIYRTVFEMLDEPHNERFRNRFIQGTLPELAFAVRSQSRHLLDAALSMDELDDSVKQSLRAIDLEFKSRRNSALDRCIRFAVDNFRSPMAAMFGRGGEDQEQYDQQLSELRDAVQRLESETSSSIRALLPGETEAEVSEQAAQRQRRETQEQMRAMRGDAAPEAEEPAPDETPNSSDQFLPGAITTHDLTLYADLLELADNERFLLEDLFEQYLATFESMTQDAMAAVASAQASVWTRNADDEAAGAATEETVGRLFDRRREAMEAIAAADATFFDDIAVTLLSDPDDPRLQRVRNARARSRYATASRGQVMGGERRVNVDLIEIARLQRWSGDVRNAVNTHLREWEQAALRSLQAQYQHIMTFQQAQQMFIAEMSRMRDEEAFDWQAINERRRELLGDSQRKLREAAVEFAQTTDAARQEIMAALPADLAAAFDDAYHRRAYPAIFRDRSAAHAYLDQAMALPDLTESQRTALTEFNMQYRNSYNELLGRMLDHRNRHGDVSIEMLEDDDWADYMAHEGTFNRMEFERAELNAKAVRELEARLSDQQLERLGPLPAPVTPRQTPW